MVSPKNVVKLASTVWYYYATHVDYVDSAESHTWTLQTKVTTDVACRATCNANFLCLQYLIDNSNGAGLGCYTAERISEETDIITHTIPAGYIIAQKTSAVTFANYNFDTVKQALMGLADPTPTPGLPESYYLCFSKPTGATTEDSSSTCGHPLPDINHLRVADGSIYNGIRPSEPVNNIFSCNSKGEATSCLPGSGIDGTKCTRCTKGYSSNVQMDYSVGGPGACLSCGAGSFCAKSTSPIISSCDYQNRYGFNAAFRPRPASCSLCVGTDLATSSTTPCVHVTTCNNDSSICSNQTGYVLNCKAGYGFSGISNTPSASCLSCSIAEQNRSRGWSAGGQLTCTACFYYRSDYRLRCDATNSYLTYCPSPYPLIGTAGTAGAMCGNTGCPAGQSTDGTSGCH